MMLTVAGSGDCRMPKVLEAGGTSYIGEMLILLVVELQLPQLC